MKCPDCGQTLVAKRISRRGEEHQYVLTCAGPHSVAGQAQLHGGERITPKPTDPRIRRGE